jgi:hypothetical protein
LFGEIEDHIGRTPASSKSAQAWMGVMKTSFLNVMRRTAVATLVASGAFVVLFGNSHAAEGANPKQAILLVLMSGTAAVHIIEMPDIRRCREAAEFTPSAKCVQAAKKGKGLDPSALLDFVPALGPLSRDGKKAPRQVYPLPNITYKPLD